MYIKALKKLDIVLIFGTLLNKKILLNIDYFWL